VGISRDLRRLALCAQNKAVKPAHVRCRSLPTHTLAQPPWPKCAGEREEAGFKIKPGGDTAAARPLFTPAACRFTPVHVTETSAAWPRGKICHECKIESESGRKPLRNWRPAKKVNTLRRDRVRHWHTRNWLALCHRLAWMLESSGGRHA